jgi:tetratricopeptide (TPR) repeat protein
MRRFAGSAGRIRSLVSREWPVILGFVAILSLPLYPFIKPTPQKILAAQQRELELAQHLIKLNDYRSAEFKLIEFFKRYPGSKLLPEAYFTLARAIIESLKEEGFVAFRLDNALELLSRARKGGIPEGRLADLEHQAAILLEENKSYQKAIEIYKGLVPTLGPRILLKIAKIYGLSLPVSPEDIHSRIIDTFAYLDRYIGEVPKDQALAAHLLKLKVFDRFKEYEAATELISMLKQAYLQAKDKEKGLIEFVEGKILLHMDKIDLAERSFLASTRYLAKEQILLEKALYYLGYTRMLKLDPKTMVPLSELIAAKSVLTPIAHLVAGRYYLGLPSPEGMGKEAFTHLSLGLKGLKDTGLLTEYELKLETIRDILKSQWVKETSGKFVKEYLTIMREIERIEPEEVKYKQDVADIYLHLARIYRRESDQERLAGNLTYSQELLLLSDTYHHKRAQKLLEITVMGAHLPHSRIAEAYRQAAEAYRSGRYFIQAAETFAKYAKFLTQPQEALLNQAICLKSAKVYHTEDPEKPDALKILDSCIKLFDPKSPLTHQAMFERIEILIELGRYEAAISDSNLILKDDLGVYGVTPESDIWKGAIYFNGLASFKLAQKLSSEGTHPQEEIIRIYRQAREAFGEYLERYQDNLPPYGLECTFYMARLEFLEERWESSVSYLRKTVELVKEEIGTQAGIAKLACFYIGDAYYNLGDYTRAIRAYEAAIRRYAGDKDRIWGLIGLARSYLRLGKLKSAINWFENARTIFEINRKAFEQESAQEFGAGFWSNQLATLEKEIEKGATD